LNQRYKGFDLFAFVFSILVITLHLNFTEFSILIIQQYLARLAVPFFFTLSGFFFYNSVSKYNIDNAFHRQFNRVGSLFLIFYVINLPFYLYNYLISPGFTLPNLFIFIQHTIFLTPGYLWYLSALLVAIVLFRFAMKFNAKTIFLICTVLYIFGTLGNSYVYILNLQSNIYFKIFLTTRNGLFFGFPLFALGFYYNKFNLILKKSNILFIVLVLCFYIIEVTAVRINVSSNVDTSIFFTLPFIIVILFNLISKLDIKISESSSLFLRKTSTLIYGTQFLFITFAFYFTRFISVWVEFPNLVINLSLIFIIPISCLGLTFLISKWKHGIIWKYL